LVSPCPVLAIGPVIAAPAITAAVALQFLSVSTEAVTLALIVQTDRQILTTQAAAVQAILAVGDVTADIIPTALPVLPRILTATPGRQHLQLV
jgi:hypothetical protein